VVPLSGFDLERSEEGLFKSTAAMKNISELTSYIDSLNKKYTQKVENQFEDFNVNKVFRKEYYPVKKVARDFMSYNERKFDKFNVNTIFDSLSLIQKRAVLSNAIENLKDGTKSLVQKNESLHWDVKTIKKYEVEWNKKLTLSFACLVFFFIGAPLGAIIRKGGLGTPAVISIFFFVIYYVISISSQKLVEEDIVGTFAGMWAASYILLPIGVFLTYKATTDSVIMNIDTYLLFFKKIKDFVYRIFINGDDSKSVSE